MHIVTTQLLRYLHSYVRQVLFQHAKVIPTPRNEGIAVVAPVKERLRNRGQRLFALQVLHGDRQDLLNIRVHLAVDHRADQPPESINLPIFFIGFHSAYFYNLIKAVAIQKTGVPFQVKKYFVQGICSFFLGYCSLF